MTLKFSVLITGDASQLKAAAGAGEAAVADLRKEAAAAGADLAKLDAGLDGAAAAATKATAAIGGAAEAQTRATTAISASAGVTSTVLAQTGETAKLTSAQFLNLTRQGNDMVTMWMLNAPVMQIFASQAGQIYDAIASGPGGLTGGLKAITGGITGFVGGLSRTTLMLSGVGIGLTAVTAAAMYFSSKISAIQPLEDVIKRQTDVVKELREAYKLTGDSAEDYKRRAMGALQEDANRQSQETKKRLQQGVETLTTDFFSGRDNYANRKSAEFAEVRAAVADLIASAKNGPADFIRLREALAGISRVDPKKGGIWDGFTRGDLARSISDSVKELADLQTQLAAAGNIQVELERRRASAARGRYQTARENLNEFVPDTRSQREPYPADNFTPSTFGGLWTTT